MGPRPRVKVPYKPSGGNWKHMQLHECQEVSGLRHLPVRACGVEANCELQHRTKVNSRKAGRPGLDRLGALRPISSCGRHVVRAGAAGSLGPLPRENPLGPKAVESLAMGIQCPRVSFESNNGMGNHPWLTSSPSDDSGDVLSDRLIVALKPRNGGGAKGTTS